MTTNATYDAFLRRTAAPWGIVLPADRLLDDADIPRPQVVEVLPWTGPHGWRATIELVTLHGLWSFCGSVQTSLGGSSYGPCLKFCPPFATRDVALTAACAWIRSYPADHGQQRPLDPALCRWLDSLQPQQLSLFAL